MKNIGNAILSNKFLIGAIGLTVLYFFVILPALRGKVNDNYYMKLENINPNKNLLTISDEEAREIAEQLYMLMDGITIYRVPVDEWQKILNKVQTKEDGRLVVKAFGIRDGETLPEMIRGEYSLKWTNSLYQQILNKFGNY